MGHKIILPSAWMMLAIVACNDTSKNFEGEKFEKDKNSGTVADSSGSDTEAVPPTMISGGFLYCEWIDTSEAGGKCRIQDTVGATGKKIPVTNMVSSHWSVAKRDGGASLPNEVIEMLPEYDPWHTRFSLPTELAGLTNISVNYQPNPNIFPTTFDLNATVSRDSETAVTISGAGAQTPLGNLFLDSATAASLPEQSRQIFFWPDPSDFRSKALDGAAVLSADNYFNRELNLLKMDFDPSVFCGPSGNIRTEVNSDWATVMNARAAATDEPWGVIKPAIVKGSIKVDFTDSKTHCIEPLFTSRNSRSMQTNDGGCYFILLRDFSSSGQRQDPQPFLAIMTSEFAKTVGFDWEQLESAADEFKCSR